MQMSGEKNTELKTELKEKKTLFSPIFFEVGTGMGTIEKGIHWVTSIIMILL